MRRVWAIAVGMLLVTAGSACSLRGSAVNEIGLIYSGGLVEDKEFKGFLEPGATAENVGFGSAVYKYRTDQRSFIGDVDGKTRDTGPLTFVSKDGVRLVAPFQLYFKLNRDRGKDDSGGVIRRFHENLRVKTKA